MVKHMASENRDEESLEVLGFVQGGLGCGDLLKV